MIRLTLSTRPPTTNNLFRETTVNNNALRGLKTTRIRVKTAQYREWAKSAERELHAQRLDVKHELPLKTPVALTLFIPKWTKRKEDLGNREKALTDALVNAGYIKDDSQIGELRLFWSESSVVHIVIEECTSLRYRPVGRTDGGLMAMPSDEW